MKLEAVVKYIVFSYFNLILKKIPLKNIVHTHYQLKTFFTFNRLFEKLFRIFYNLIRLNLLATYLHFFVGKRLLTLNFK